MLSDEIIKDKIMVENPMKDIDELFGAWKDLPDKDLEEIRNAWSRRISKISKD